MIWGQADRGSAMQVLHRKIADHARTLRITEDIFDDIEPALRKDTLSTMEQLTKAVYVALADVRSFLGCFDYFAARCVEAGLTPDEARHQWETHAPEDFLTTMRDWQEVGPNEIALVDQFILAPMGLPSCPDKQTPDGPAPGRDPQDAEDPAP